MRWLWVPLCAALLLLQAYRGCVPERRPGGRVAEPDSEGHDRLRFAQAARAACADAVRNEIFAGDGTQEETEGVLAGLGEAAVCGEEPTPWFWEEGPALACAWALERLRTPTAVCALDAVEAVCAAVERRSPGLVTAQQAFRMALLRWAVRSGFRDPPGLLRLFPAPEDLRADLLSGGAQLSRATGIGAETLAQTGPLPLLLGGWWPGCVGAGLAPPFETIWRRWGPGRLAPVLLEPEQHPELPALQEEILAALAPPERLQLAKRAVWKRIEAATVRHGKRPAKWPPEERAWDSARRLLKLAKSDLRAAAAELAAGSDPHLCGPDTRALLGAVLGGKGCLAERLLRWRWQSGSARDESVVGQLLPPGESDRPVTPSCRLAWLRFPMGMA